MPLVLVPAICVQPRSALLQQIGSQWDAFDPNQSEQLANRCECLPRTERHKDDVTFNGAQVRLGGFSDRPGQVGFVHESLHDHDPFAVRSGSNSRRPSWQRRILTTSHGQAMREPPSFVLTWISTVPMSVILPTRVPTCTVSPISNFTFLPPRLSKASPSRVLVATGTSWPSPSVVESWDGQLGAGMPRKFISPIAPIDSVPNRVRVDDGAYTLPFLGP